MGEIGHFVIIPATPSVLDGDGVRRTVMRFRQVEVELGEKSLGREIPLGVLLCRAEPETSLCRCIKADPTDAGLPLLETEVRRRVGGLSGGGLRRLRRLPSGRSARPRCLFREVEARLASASERERERPSRNHTRR